MDDGPATDDGRRRVGSRPSVVRPSSIVVPAGVFLVAAFALLGRAGQVGYNTDEGQFISTAQYFEYVFRNGDVSGPQWDETYWTLTQPPITRYILGAAIWASGNPLPRVNLDHRIEEVRGPDRERFLDPHTFANERQLAEQRRIERPGSAVLQASRVPMALFGAGATALLFLLGRALAGTLAGLVAAAGLLLAPLSLTLLPRAHAEAPLLFFVLLGLFLGVRSTLNVERWTLNGMLAGLATGLGAATKLPAVLGIGAFVAFSVWAFVLGRVRPGCVGSRAWRWSALATAVALVVMVAVNPFLWPNPPARMMAMLQFRQQELVGQRTLNAEDAVAESVPIRAALLLQRTFVTEMPLARRTGLPVEAALAVVGVAALGWRALRDRAVGGLVGPEALTLAWLATFLAGTAPNLGLDWQRYYLPTVGLGLVLVGVGAETLVGALLRTVRTNRQAPSASAATPPPITTASSGSAG